MAYPHERITAYIAAGSVIVMVSVILITGAKHTRPSPRRAGAGSALTGGESLPIERWIVTTG